jgi:hypothetical protein
MLFTVSSSSSFYFLPSCLRVSFFRLPAIFLIFFATRNFAYSRLFPAHCAYVLPQQKCKHVRSAVLETWMGSERASGEGEVLWSGESRPGRVRRCGRDLGCNRGSKRARSVVESRDLDATSQTSAKIYSRPGCNEPSKCENLLETWMQRASECENLLETWMQRASECENLLETWMQRAKRVRKSARDLYVETWMESSVKVRFGASRLRMPRKPNTA